MLPLPVRLRVGWDLAAISPARGLSAQGQLVRPYPIGGLTIRKTPIPSAVEGSVRKGDVEGFQRRRSSEAQQNPLG